MDRRGNGPHGARATLPQGWEILQAGPIDNGLPLLDAGLRRTQRIEVLAWDTGFKVIEPCR